MVRGVLQKVRTEIMIQEHKDLLMKDLCSRLPFGVKVEHICSRRKPSDLLCIDAEKGVIYCAFKGREDKYKIEFVKPYLRSMSDMTKQEKKEYESTWFENYHLKDTEEAVWETDVPYYIDWLNAHHFDYRGLIERGLAIEVTVDYNPYEL